MSAQVLLIDDEAVFREDLATLLREDGYDCVTAADGEEGIALAERTPPDLVLCDLVMPKVGGVEVVERLGSICPDVPVILLTAYGSLETAVAAFRQGAVDYLVKPVVPEDLLQRMKRALDTSRLQREIRYLRRTVSQSGAGTTLVGESAVMLEVKRLIAKVAAADSPVLITGPSGTGKELVARAIHETGFGEDRPFVALNCAALPRELAESELFGHVRGAFTGAVRDKPGVFELAAGGTLFLDEIGELLVDLQAKLLRALDHKEITRVGGTRPLATPVRILAASNRDLGTEIEAGNFREDLYFRLRVVEIALPPLSARREDIPPLVDHLLGRLNLRLNRAVRGVDHAAMQVLMAASWPGNVRELENVLERAVLLADGDYLGLGDLPTELTGPVHFPEQSDDLRSAVRTYEARHIQQVLAAVDGNREEAARRLGIDASTLYRRLKSLEF